MRAGRGKNSGFRNLLTEFEMWQLEIDNKAEKAAYWYSKLLHQYIREGAKEKIGYLIDEFKKVVSVDLYDSDKHLITTLPSSQIVEYLILLDKRYDALKIMHPRKFNREIQKFEAIIGREFINLKMRVPGSTNFTPSLAHRIIKAMNYKDVREKVYPRIARFLELKTCVYCNANFTISASDGNGYYELDHWKPKTLYPYLSTSFYNLQPCCSSCNRRKSNDDREYFHLWNGTHRKQGDVIGVNLTRKSIVLYKVTHHTEDLVPVFYSAKRKYTPMRNVMQERLHIEERYKEHLDIAEEVIWRSMAYNPSMLKSLRKSFSRVVPSNADVNRFIIGTYSKRKDVHKRPLTLLRQNIARQLGLLK